MPDELIYLGLKDEKGKWTAWFLLEYMAYVSYVPEGKAEIHFFSFRRKNTSRLVAVLRCRAEAILKDLAVFKRCGCG